MERLAGSVRRALQGVGVPDAGQMAELTAAWPTLVGSAIARAAWPQRISRDGTLVVAASSSTWAFELDRMAPEILAKLRRDMPSVAPAGLRFVTGLVPEPPAASGEGASASRVAVASAHIRTAETLAAPIDDEDLRASVVRAAAASLARARDDRGF